MIDEDATFEQFGYKNTDLKPRSGKKIVAVCDGCGKVRMLQKHDYRDLCHLCAASNVSDETRKKMSESGRGRVFTEEHRRRLSEANKGKIPSEETLEKMSESSKGKTHSKETLKKMSEARRGKTLSEEHRKNISKANKGKTHSEETKQKMSESASNRSEEWRKKMSAAKQGIPYDEWESFAKESPYCPKFNLTCRESNREKYSRRCFVCGKHESDNITKTRKQKRLSVHHVDMDKMQGCNGHRWRLIPTCIEHHGKVHSDLWMYRIIYLLENVYSI